MRDSKSTQNITFQKFDHYFDLELSLFILKHNLLRLIYAKNQMTKEINLLNLYPNSQRFQLQE
jgi:hypothetical protein